MKKKIKELFKQYYNDETMPVIELEDKVLALFDVVGQSEQLPCGNPEHEDRMNKNGFCDWCRQDIYRK